MKRPCKAAVSVLALVLAAGLRAAAPQPPLPVIAMQERETDDAAGFAAWIDRYNAVAKAKLGLDPYIHVLVSAYDGTKSNAVRTLIVADSVATLTAHAQALDGDPALSDIRRHLAAISRRGARVLLQGVRVEGSYRKGSFFVTDAVVGDEAGFLSALDRLRTLFDRGGLADAKINAYRVLAGRRGFTHRILIQVPSDERLAALLDFIGRDPQLAAWLAQAAKVRTVVANGTGYEITP